MAERVQYVNDNDKNSQLREEMFCSTESDRSGLRKCFAGPSRGLLRSLGKCFAARLTRCGDTSARNEINLAR
jgi:hypothetical protein